MSKEPSTYLEKLRQDVERWKEDTERMRLEGNAFWYERYLQNLASAIVELKSFEPQRFNPLRQMKLVERERRKGYLR